jgi:hypothetical protein
MPPHLAEDVCIKAEKTGVRDLFGLQRLNEGHYEASQIDSVWTDEIWADFHTWRKDNTPPEYQHLDWEGEEEEVRRRQTGQAAAA